MDGCAPKTKRPPADVIVLDAGLPYLGGRSRLWVVRRSHGGALFVWRRPGLWPLPAKLTPPSIAALGGWVAIRSRGELSQVFLALVAALTAFGTINAAAAAVGAWVRRPSEGSGSFNAIAKLWKDFNRRALMAAISDLDATHAYIAETIREYPIVLFMKGSPSSPQCGFSATIVDVLRHYDVSVHAIDVLSNPAVRQGIKVYSDWPTIPQLYVNGAFVGGCDIVREMHETGELAELMGAVRTGP
jgi:monothiol glutaredoxin